MNRRSLFWGTTFLAIGVLLAVRPPAGIAEGPRIGMTALLIMFGLTLMLAANAEWFLRKTTRPEDYQGTCPVGESCGACGAFNYKPRKDCRSCGGPVNRPDQA